MAEITEAKIRQAIWMIKAKKTKKSICEHLGIAYNTKRLDQIIKDFHDRQEREAELKKKARSKIFSKTEKQSIADDYLSGDSQSAIAKRNYISPQRVKNILMEMNVPIRARGKGKAAKVDHVVQDLEVRFNKNDKVKLKKIYNYKSIVEDPEEIVVEKINPYLIPADNIFIHKLNTQIDNYPEMKFGSMPNDGGNFKL